MFFDHLLGNRHWACHHGASGLLGEERNRVKVSEKGRRGGPEEGQLSVGKTGEDAEGLMPRLSYDEWVGIRQKRRGERVPEHWQSHRHVMCSGNYKFQQPEGRARKEEVRDQAGEVSKGWAVKDGKRTFSGGQWGEGITGTP